MPDFQDYLERARLGDEEAFVRLFRTAQPALLRYLTTLAPDLAEDAAAETWVAVVKGLHRFQGDESGWRAWVLTIGHARLRDAQRKAARSPDAVPWDDETARSVTSAVETADELHDAMSVETAVALVRSLPRDQAQVVLLRYVLGLDVAATAAVLGKRPGAVRVAAHRGLRRLELHLSDHADRPDLRPM